MHPIRAALLILFAQSRFNRAALDYAVKYECTVNNRFKEHFERGEVSSQDTAKMAENATKQAQALRRVAGEGFMLALLTMVAGYLVGYGLAILLGAPPKWAQYGLQAIGASAILSASIAASDKVGIETFDGDSLVERVHGAFFRGLVALGTFVFVVSVGWDSV